MANNFFDFDDNNDKARGKEKPKFPTAIWYVMAILILIGIQVTFFWSNTTTELPYSQFRKELERGNVESVKISPSRIWVHTKEELVFNSPANSLMRARPATKDFYTIAPMILANSEFVKELEDKGVKYQFVQDGNWFTDILQWIFPFVILLGIWMFVFRRMNPNSQVMNIGKNKAALYEEPTDGNRITFKDVAGLEEAKEEVMEIVDFLKDPKKFTKLGGKLPKGVLLVGPPGAGKTLMAKAVAGEAGVPFFSLSGSDFVEMFVGVGAARVRDLFRTAKEKAPCIIFIDEIDAVGRSRGKGMMMGVNDERENTLNQLLVEMDGFATDKGVIIMAATNRPDVLDPALLRPGRFDRQIVIDKPDLNGRIDIFKVHTKNIPLGKDVDIRTLASQTPGFAGAEIANVCNEAALLASRRGKEAVEMIDFQDAIERVIAGLEKKNKVINPKEKKIVAYHESGHAIVSWLLPGNDPPQKVTIVPRGVSALGYTLNTPLEDRYLMTKQELFARICGLLGGRVSEEIVFGEISTGAQNDLERVTDIAYSMVAVYGMSEKLGYLSFADTSNAFLQGIGIEKRYGSEIAHLIDAEVKRIVDEAHEATRKLLMDNRDKLERMAQELLKREVLTYKDIEDILGKRPNLDDMNTNKDLSQIAAADETVAVVVESSTNTMAVEERAALEAAVEKLKAKRAHEN
ncbi:MAG: AAA family ATPase [[Chlorobium] sp. 445]|nr:MAG: AAA family ATPase [[Chlorobium] sp. 445]